MALRTIRSRAHCDIFILVKERGYPMKKIRTAFFVFLIFSVVCAGAIERRVLIIPTDSFEQKFSERMSQQMSTLEREGALSALSSWPKLPELPPWVFVERKREIAYIFSRRGVSDDYRYAVILGRKKELIVVRAGGIGGSYEVFAKSTVTRGAR